MKKRMSIIIGVILCGLALCLGLSESTGNEQNKNLVGVYNGEVKKGSYGWESIKFYQNKDNITLKVVFKNKTDSNILLGTNGSPITATIETSEGEYSISGYLDNNNCYESKEFSMTFAKAKGKIKSLAFGKITFLVNDRLSSDSEVYKVTFN